MFSKTCEYAIKATLYIAKQSNSYKKVSLKEIANTIESPEAFTGKILQILVKHKIVSSLKGRGGGFYIDESKLAKLSLRNIVMAIDGDKLFTGCALGLKECNEKKPCPLHNQFITIRDNLSLVLTKTTLKDLSEDLNEGYTFLSR